MTTPRMSQEKLIAFAAGELSGEEAALVEAFLMSNPESRQTVDHFRAVQRTVSSDDSVAPPAEVVARAKSIFSQATAPSEPTWLEKFDALVARIVWDSRLQPAAVRYSGTDEHFQLAYESDEAEVDLQVQRLASQGTSGADAPWRLMGQVAVDDAPSSCRVAVVRPGGREPLDTTSTDERGMFTLDLAPGTYDICIEIPGGVVVLPGVNMR